jgi:single-stranded DNA-binding protein
MTTFRLPGTERTRVNWHFVQCVAFGKVAKHAKAICQNDEFVMVDGYIESFLAKKEDGTERNVSRVRAYSIGLLGHTYRPGTASANSGKCSDNEDQTREEEKEEDQYPEDATIVDGDGDLPF